MVEDEKSAIVMLPYTSRINRFGRICMSSHTALVVEAARLSFNKGIADYIFIPGENTFGTNYPSTADLVRTQLIKKGVPEDRIITVGNLNNTEAQLEEAKRQSFSKTYTLAMKFHLSRVELLKQQIGLSGQVIVAEDVIVEGHKGATDEKLKKFAVTEICMFGKSKVEVSEFIIRTGTRFGRFGKTVVELIRLFSGQNGPTVTDYHFVGSARKCSNEAIQKGLVLHVI